MTIADTGLPGRPKTSFAVARAEPGGLAGRADAPEALLDAELGQRGLHVVVRAHRHAAGHDHDVGVLERAASAARVASRVVGHAPRATSSAPAADLGARRIGVRARRSAPGASGSPGLGELVAGDEHGHARARAQRELGAPQRGSNAELGGAEPVPRPSTRHARAHVLARAADVVRRLGVRHRDRPSPARPSTGTTASAPPAPPPRSRSARRCRARRPRRVPGARLADHSQLGRAGQTAPRSRPSRSCRTAARRPLVTSSASTRPRHRSAAPSSRPAGARPSSTRRRASSIGISSVIGAMFSEIPGGVRRTQGYDRASDSHWGPLARLERSRDELAKAWLVRLIERASLDEIRELPTEKIALSCPSYHRPRGPIMRPRAATSTHEDQSGGRGRARRAESGRPRLPRLGRRPRRGRAPVRAGSGAPGGPRARSGRFAPAVEHLRRQSPRYRRRRWRTTS